MKKENHLDVQINTRIVLDHLTWGWMCPICECIYSPYVQKCPENHKISKTWVKEDKAK